MTVHLDGPSDPVDFPEVKRALAVLLDPNGAHELRGLPSGKSRLVRGDDLDGAVLLANELASDNAIYFTLNPVNPTIGHRAARVGDILSRRWLLIDVDRKKKPGDVDCMATDAEKSDALALTAEVNDWLLSEGWPCPVMIDSGNGGHLLFRIDLPADDLSKAIIAAALRALALRWDAPGACIDPVVHNASRISKLPGTWVRKGPSTPDRPWRMARLIYVPQEIGIVSAEQINALAQQPDKRPNTFDPWSQVVPPGARDKTAAYIKSAFEREISRVALAGPGSRNNALNTAAFSIGQLVGTHAIGRGEAERQLSEAARSVGLGDHEIAASLKSGLDAGILKPRVLPASLMGSANNGAPPAATKTTGKLTIGLDEIVPKKVDWLYENRIAPGFITIFAGKTGLGKSFVTCDIVAKFSLGCAAAYSALNHAPIRTLFMSEDSPEIVIGPRLLEMGADATMIRFMTWEAMAAYTLADTAMLNQAYQECGQPKLLVIDPPANFLGSVDEHKNAEIRAVLKLLIAWLDTHNVACIFIMHINKAIGKGLEAVERIIGSVAWGSSARMTLAFTKDPNTAGQMLFGGTKNNLGPMAETIAYKVVSTSTLATVQWLGKVDTSMEDAMNSVKKKSRGQCAVEWLTERFREKREWESDVLKDDAANNGISKNALWSPEAQALPILKRQRINAAGDRAWYWVADVGWPPLEKHRESQESGKVETQPF
jgi:hypothetical protein